MGKRLRPKYEVQKVGLQGNLIGPRMKATDPDNVDSPFVLMPRKDPSAYAAMVTYARMCEPELAREIKEFLYKVVDAEPVFGTQGTRNLKAVRRRSLSDIMLAPELTP